MRLNAVRLQIDGQLVAHYIYSAKELQALRKGGVQRIYVGNVATGDHKLEVLVDGKLEGGAVFSRTGEFTFRKEVKPKLVGLTLPGPRSGNTPIALGEWESMRATRQLIGLAVAVVLAARPLTGGELRDPYFGDALYHAYRGQDFDAL